MGANGYSVYEAAVIMGVSEKTIRRHIKSGKLKAFIDPGKYGDTYRIPELPPEFEGKVPAIPKKQKTKAATNAEVIAKLDTVLSRLDKLENVQPQVEAPATGKPAEIKPKKRRQVKDKGDRVAYAKVLIKDNPTITNVDVQAQVKAKFGHGIRMADLILLRKGGKAK